MIQGVSLPCSRLRRKAAAIGGMQSTHGPSGVARVARLTQPGPTARLRLFRLLTILLTLGSTPLMADSTPPASAEGQVVQYEVKGGGMLANVDVDWDRYTKALLDKATVEFREDWVEDQARLNNNVVRDRDLAQIRSWISNMLHDVLSSEISNTDGYTLTDVGGADVLRYTPRIAKLDLHAPGNTQVIVGNVLVDSKGSMVLVMDISDSMSGELLASAWRVQVDPDKGFMTTATEAGNKTAFKRMMENWAVWFFAMLDHVRAEKPGSE